MDTCMDAREDGWRHAWVDGRRRESISEPQKTLGPILNYKHPVFVTVLLDCEPSPCSN